jgi:hypothetical protein
MDDEFVHPGGVPRQHFTAGATTASLRRVLLPRRRQQGGGVVLRRVLFSFLDVANRGGNDRSSFTVGSPERAALQGFSVVDLVVPRHRRQL